MSSASESRTYLTGDVPGIGGIIKQRPEDFLVEEIPLYQPCGEGEHIYMFVQKKDMTTQAMIAVLARHFGVPIAAIGCAGLKDKRAMTRQVISIHAPGKTPEDFPSLKDPRIEILWTDLHTNKLRRGHLKGNRFSVRIRNVAFRQVFEAQKVLERLEKVGVPNRFGPQRFGMFGLNHRIGAAMLLGDAQRACDLILGGDPANLAASEQVDETLILARKHYQSGQFVQALECYRDPHSLERRMLQQLLHDGAAATGVLSGASRAIAVMKTWEREIYLNAAQSAMFNFAVDCRVRSETFATLQGGDVAMKLDNGAVFDVELDAPVSADLHDRLARKLIAPTGPMWGPEMKQAHRESRQHQIELQALAWLGLNEKVISSASAPEGLSSSTLLRGHRRALSAQLSYVEVEGGGDEHGMYVRCGFELPAGAYATAVLDEVMKVDAGESASTAIED